MSVTDIRSLVTTCICIGSTLNTCKEIIHCLLSLSLTLSVDCHSSQNFKKLHILKHESNNPQIQVQFANVSNIQWQKFKTFKNMEVY